MVIKKNYFFLLISILSTIPAFFSILRPGFFPMQDDMQAFRIQQMGKCFDDFQIPCRWIPDAGYGYGYPLFNFYAPAVYYLGAIFHLIGFQIIDSIKILFILGFIFSAVSIFILVREFTDKWSAFVASVLYTYVPFRAAEMYVRGAIGEFFAFVFFPLLFWASYKLVKEGSRKYFVYFSLSLSGIILTHNLSTVGFSLALGVWIIYWLFAYKSKQAVLNLFISSFLGIAISSFFLLPALFEKSYVHIETLLGGYFDYRQHFLTFNQIFFSNNWGYGSSMLGSNDDLALSPGILHLIIGVVATVFAVFNLKKNRMISVLILILLGVNFAYLFLMHQKSAFIWEKVGVLPWFQFPWRFLSESTFLLAFLAGFLVYFSNRAKHVVGLVIIIMVFNFYGSFFHPKSWLEISDSDKFSGENWEKALTASIFDYLPIYAQQPPESRASDLPEAIKGDTTFSDYKKGSDYQKGKLKVMQDSTIRLPLYDFPGMQVKLNEKPIDHRHDDCTNQTHCLGLITFDVGKGEYSLWVGLTDTPIRKVGNALTIIGILTLIYLTFNMRRKNV